MKGALSTVVCVLLALALVVFAISNGAVRGWNDEREQALHALTENAGLASILSNRAMDAANLAVVASRHLPADDQNILALRNAYTVMSDGDATADELAQADAALTQAAALLAKTLPELSSVQKSQRDQVYISTLTRTLSEGTSAAAAYLDAVEDFNTRLNRSLTGKLAMLLGVQPLGAQ